MSVTRAPSKPWRVYGPRGIPTEHRGQRAAYDAVATITKLGDVARVHHWEGGSWRLYEVVRPVTPASITEEGQES